MNTKGILKILSFVVGIEGVFMLLPAIVGLVYKEYKGAAVYFIIAFICIFLCAVHSVFLKRHPGKLHGFYGKEGFVATALSWILMSLIGAVPFVVTGDIPNYIDAVFETVSGFTTTGASVIPDLSEVLHCNLFFRCFTNWLGGMGVLVFILAIMPMTGGSPLSLMKAESPGPTVSKLVPKAQHTALILYAIYVGLTLIFFLLIVWDPSLTVFEAICHALGTAATGGFGLFNDSCAGYSDYVNIVTVVFMMLCGTNFSFFYLIILGRIKEAFKLEELRWYFGLYVASVGMILANLVLSGFKALDSVLGVCFTCASVMTTTGFTYTDFGDWSVFTNIILILLMFAGGCAGSTSGGFKITRLALLVKQIGRDVRKQIHPNRITVIKMDGKPVSEDVLASTNRLFITYVFILVVSLMVVSLDGFDILTTFAGVFSTYNNIGVGLGNICVGDSYAMFSVPSKLVMILDMLFGRLEIIPMFLLFSPSTWKK